MGQPFALDWQAATQCVCKQLPLDGDRSELTWPHVQCLPRHSKGDNDFGEVVCKQTMHLTSNMAHGCWSGIIQ